MLANERLVFRRSIGPNPEILPRMTNAMSYFGIEKAIKYLCTISYEAVGSENRPTNTAISPINGLMLVNNGAKLANNGAMLDRNGAMLVKSKPMLGNNEAMLGNNGAMLGNNGLMLGRNAAKLGEILKEKGCPAR